MSAKGFYEGLAIETQGSIASLSRRATLVSWLRVAVFIAIVAGIYLLWDSSTLCILSSVAGLAIFLFLIKYHDRLLRLKARQETKLHLAQSRLRVIAGDLSCQPQGRTHIDQMHRFSFDLDIFGADSLYSILDSTATSIGASHLAHWLKNPLTDNDAIVARQKAIKELAQMNTLRTEFHASGKTIEKEERQETPDFSNRPSFHLPIPLTILAYCAAPTLIAFIILNAMGFIPGTAIMWLIVGYLFVASLASKKTSKLHQWLCSTVERLTSREQLFQQIENTQFQSSLMINLQNNLKQNNENASQSIKRLSRLLKSLDQRYNAVGFILFNGTMLWDITIINRIDRWMEKYGDNLTTWMNTLGEIDALCALATYAFENPEYTYPQIDATGKTIMQAEEMGHPLIHKSKRINNPLPIMAQHSFIIITGANMAGKSTYLRTIGINYLLAMVGAPVAAKSMIFTPASLFTGLRANDSLANGESYFFAELKRLQAVVDEASQGKPMFILLDEILRGTNSADKQRGSLALVKKLITLPIGGVLATHDLVLGNLANEFPNNISAYCFEAEIKDDNLTFDYTLHEGVAHNLNAYFLMEKMGIV
ncbi:MAG: hypothetical protein IKL35_06635 [Muribaculaceae bacterium]|nr:hypothetical protein [Muribaculaceae bacterium]